MIRFECDYNEGAHPFVLDALTSTNYAQTIGYGEDEYCEDARALIKEICASPSAAVHFFVGGTQTNATVISSLLKPYEGIGAADSGHIAVHETGAVEAYGHKVITLPASDGKIDAESVKALFDSHHQSPAHEHMVKPGAVYISHPTETGTLYSKDELSRLYSVCKKLGLYLYIDGARFGYALGSDANDVRFEDMKELPRKAVQGALSKFGATTVDSGKYDILFDGKQFRAFLSAFSSAFSAKDAQMGLSKLAGKEGERIAADCVTVVDDPLCEWNPMKMSFDGEGVATYRKSVIERGILKTLLYDLATAERAGVQTTGNGQRTSYAAQVNIRPFAFYIEAGELTDGELMAKMGDGIYITELKGLHSGLDSVTGDFSLESAGFLVENGKKTNAVKGFTIAGNFFDLLKNIVAVSSEIKHGGGGSTCFASPDILLPEMSVAGK